MEQIAIYLFITASYYLLCVIDSEINAIPLCLGNVLKDFSVDNMKSFYNFSVDYDAITVDDILDVHKY